MVGSFHFSPKEDPTKAVFDKVPRQLEAELEHIHEAQDRSHDEAHGRAHDRAEADGEQDDGHEDPERHGVLDII